ncbi:MAG: hypothetical protein AAF697_03685 [Pseudomonadota bacterium]
MKRYWQNHLWIDPLAALIMASTLWLAPAFGGPVYFEVCLTELPTRLASWLVGNLTLMGLIIATSGFLTSVLETSDFLPLAKSKSASQLWEILRQNLGYLFLSAGLCVIGSFWAGSLSMLAYASTFVGLILLISIGKVVWVMRSVLTVKSNTTAK